MYLVIGMLGKVHALQTFTADYKFCFSVFSQPNVDWLRGPTSLIFYGYQELFPQG
jgi:hypothetical protein